VVKLAFEKAKKHWQGSLSPSLSRWMLHVSLGKQKIWEMLERRERNTEAGRERFLLLGQRVSIFISFSL